MSAFSQPTAYAPRAVSLLPLRQFGGWRLKRYLLAAEASAATAAVFESGVEVALQLLPQPAVTALRPGVGYLILHRGADCDYIVLNWWDQENEHLTRVLVRARQPGARWQQAADQSFCVWDMQLMHHERNAYVQHVLGGACDLDAYLADRYGAETTR